MKRDALEMVVAVGAGQASMQLAASLRENGYRGRIVLIGDEPGLPCQRPPLSKDYLAGKIGREAIQLNPAKFFESRAIELMSATRVSAIDRRAARVELDTGQTLAYDHLVLATGARNRALHIPGSGLVGVHQLRTLAEADALRERLASARGVVVIGAGFIGLEVAALVAQRGTPVTVIENAERAMGRALSAEMSDVFREQHERAGVRFIFSAMVTDISERNGEVSGVAISNGEYIAADLVLVGIGVVPNTALAAAAGLAVEDGIQVDTQLLTNDPAISAVGDCARFPCKFANGERVRIESVQNAVDQGRTVASRLSGCASSHAAVPWFWSDQGVHKLRIAGLAMPHDTTILQRARDADEASVWRFRGGRFVGAETMNRQREHMAARKLLALELALTLKEAQAPGFDLCAYVQRAKAARQPAAATHAEAT